MKKEILLKTQQISKIYEMGENKVFALNKIDIEIYKSSFVSVMGTSGSGKTTFLNILGCLDIPTSGKYFLNNIDAGQISSKERAKLRNRTIGFIFQSFHLLARTTALENVELPLIYSQPHLSASYRREKAMHMLELVGLSDRRFNHPNQLSGGQQQRVAIARALVNDPLLILADEATGNLDSKTSVEIMELLSTLNQKGKTIVFVTHNPEISEWMDRIIVFSDGEIICDKQKPKYD